MSKINLCKTRDKRIYEERDKDYLKLIQEYKKNGDNKELKKQSKKLVNI